MQDKVLIIDCGSQYTQLIARRIRELNIFCEIKPYDINFSVDEYAAMIISGSPSSVNNDDAPQLDLKPIKGKIPLLGICYGAQYIAHTFGGKVAASDIREYGRASLTYTHNDDTFFANVPIGSQVWMSHSDTIQQLPSAAELLASTNDVTNAGFKINGETTYCIQFHPEVYHSKDGLTILKNFLVNICNLKQEWTPHNFVEQTIGELKEKIKKEQVILGLSGGVDSTVAAVLLHKAIGSQLHCIFINNGLLRKGEYDSVLEQYKGMGLNVKGVDATDDFLDALSGISDPEQKRKAIGKTFIDVFDKESKQLSNAKWLAQGTIYPDVIESISVKGPSATIKSHHNVGGLPYKMNFKVIEPLRMLFKDEVRRIGKSMNIDTELLGRHPFPGPGLAIRILGDITRENILMLQEADAIFIQGLKDHNLYDQVWQAGAILLPVNTVGVMGDKRTYEKCVALRAVESTDGMTADWVDLSYKFLQQISNNIINRVTGINRVVYDISSKPPATIEWE